MGQVLSAFRWFLGVAFKFLSNGFSVGEGQAKRALTGRGAPVPQTRQTFGLIIGIDEYKFIKPKQDLQGAVKDANDFSSYLLHDRGVPETNIINLRNGRATRSAIIEAFIKLKNNPRITPGEVAIIIYFAGHGAVAQKPAEWKNWVNPTGEVEMLCPADINRPINGKVKVEGIPDRTLSQLLLDLSDAKGNNITLILDCCHAAGINRGVVTDPTIRSRALNSQPLSPTCDKDIYSHASQIRSFQKDESGFSDSYGSHVLLAACRRTETAWEKDKSGIFTAALLGSLRSFDPRDLPPSYDSLMQIIQIPGNLNQHAHWDGRHIRRRLFDCWQEPVSSSMIPCHKGDGKRWPSGLVLHAGSLHGIKKGSTFEIFKSDSPDANSKDLITTLTVTDVKTAFSVLALTPSDSAIFTSDSQRPFWYARLRKASGPRLHIYCDNARVLDQILADDSKSRLTASVCPVKDPDKADLCLTVKEGAVLFHRGKTFSKLSSCSPPLPQSRLYHNADIRDFINRYSHFTSHLTTKSPISITSLVTIKMIKLGRSGKGMEEVALTAVDGDGRTEIVRVLDTSLDADDQDHYGFTIHQNRNIDLYVYLVYFDASKSDIEIWYSAQKSRFGDSADPCLVKDSKSKLTLGHGNTTMGPLCLDIPHGQAEDVCFIKIYVATKAVDIGTLEQLQSPGPGTKARGAKRHNLPVQLSDFEWASETIAIVTKRRNRFS
ncbi:hypothetical protein ARMGADRAFT_615393 [Armillaria gallica]|uniref:Peptidase C14 caspase domain-containing protein n=1 Tax=Armillaria gallica TaxID=47427 RepID=A0A2H3CQW0_ARMGA|nr:hypothetical protein ARMGADRAFT_615393 [Armillaria gallica]